MKHVRKPAPTGTAGITKLHENYKNLESSSLKKAVLKDLRGRPSRARPRKRGPEGERQGCHRAANGADPHLLGRTSDAGGRTVFCSLLGQQNLA